jgi:hypothetical protein
MIQTLNKLLFAISERRTFNGYTDKVDDNKIVAALKIYLW